MRIGKLEFGYWGPGHHNFRWAWAFRKCDYGNVRVWDIPPLWIRWWVADEGDYKLELAVKRLLKGFCYGYEVSDDRHD